MDAILVKGGLCLALTVFLRHRPNRVTTLPVRAALLLVCLALVGCPSSPPSLVGIYSVDDKSKRVEYLRIEEKDGKFLASESQRGAGWKKPQEVKPLGKADLEKLAGASVAGDVVGLDTNQATLFQVPKGWRADRFESKIDYVFVSLFGPVELHKGSK